MPKQKNIVSIIKCPDYETKHVEEAILNALELAELTNKFAPNASVLLKPNLLSARAPEEAVTTHPSIVAAVGKIAKSRNCNVSIGDSPPTMGEDARFYDKLITRTGIKSVADSLGIPVLRFEESIKEIQNPSSRYFRTFTVAKAIIDADIVVNVPKFKTHSLTGITGAVKNMFGAVPGIRKGLFHAQAGDNREVFNQMLVDLYAVVKPAINIMDAVLAMEGAGPNSGSPRKLGIILASSDAVALDAVISIIAGYDPLDIGTTRLAAEQGLGNASLDFIEIRGTSIEEVKVGDFAVPSGTDQWRKIPAPDTKSFLPKAPFFHFPKIKQEKTCNRMQ